MRLAGLLTAISSPVAYDDPVPPACSIRCTPSGIVCSTAIGIKLKDGVILAVEKLVQSKLLVPGANRRIATVDTHVGIVRSLVTRLREIVLILLIPGRPPPDSLRMDDT